jgi:hypothetical protein
MAVMVTVLVPVVETFVPDSGTKPTRSMAIRNQGAPAAATTVAPAPRKCFVAVETFPPCGMTPSDHVSSVGT